MPADPPRTPPLDVKAFGLTDKGRVRSANEDQFLVAELTKGMRVWHTSLSGPHVQFGDERAHLFMVADGMGGQRAGATASSLAMVAIEQFTLNTLKWFFDSNGPEAQRVLSQFQGALREADADIVEQGNDQPALTGMGTTLTMAYHLREDLCVVHVGDSRAYLFRAGELHQLTRDHTLVAELVRKGALPPGQVAAHRLRHVITNVVGGQNVGVEIEAHALHLEPGDCLLLCTDGLSEMLSAEAITAILRAEPEPEAACAKLVAQANAAGGRDNISVVMVRFAAAVS